mgnify:CR=1 FL=1
MEKTIYDGVEIAFVGLDDVTADEPKHYVDYVREHTTQPVTKIEVVGLEDGKVDVNYELQGPKFERIRRITGYLTGDLNSWNNSKRSEEHDRVKHEVVY